MGTRGVNKCIIVGNLGDDPTTKYLPNGNAVTNITVATSESYKDKNTQEEISKTEWHRVVFFGKLAEIAGEYLTKGAQVYIEGKLQTRKWQDQSGQDKYTTEIVVDSFTGVMQMLGGSQGASQQSSQQQPAQQGNSKPKQQQGSFKAELTADKLIAQAIHNNDVNWIKKEWSGIIGKEWGNLPENLRDALNEIFNGI